MAKKKGDAYGGDNGNDRDFDEEPDFEDPEGFVDDIADDGKRHERIFSPAICGFISRLETVYSCELSASFAELLADLLEKKPCETDGKLERAFIIRAITTGV